MAKRTNVVAVIDDNVLVLESIKALLSVWGYDVELYASSEAFLAAVSSTGASCLIVDVQIGKSDGIDLVRQLNASGFNFSIIFLTAIYDETVRKRAEKAGCVAFLRKPLFADLLVEALVRVERET